MNFYKALARLIAGEKVRADHWDVGQYIHVVDGEVRNDYGSKWGVFNRVCHEMTWEIYKEPVEEPSAEQEIKDLLAVYETKLEGLAHNSNNIANSIVWARLELGNKLLALGKRITEREAKK